MNQLVIEDGFIAVAKKKKKGKAGEKGLCGLQFGTFLF